MISCIILAGGKSNRMQPEESKLTRLKKKIKKKAKKKVKTKPKKNPKIVKAFMPLAERPLVMHVHDTVTKFFSEVVIVMKTRAQQKEMQALVNSPKVTVVADKSKSFSPITGIKTGLDYATSENVFVIGCDMPFVNGVTIFRMINRVKKGIDCVVPSKNREGGRRYEPLCAIYSRRVFDDCDPEESLHDVIDRSKKLMIPMYNENVFFNINTPEDLKLAEQMLEGKGKK
jgi:molybdopterin-guanine dinucleotide biosynthesis protein A